MPSSIRRLAGVALAGALIAAELAANGPRFYPDDPIAVDNDKALDASGIRPREDSDYYDFIENTFFPPGDPTDIPAVNVNTLGEVPDSTWFTNRIGQRPMSIAELVRGPDRVERLSIDGWPIVQGKSEGLQGGWRVADPTGHLYQIEFDPSAYGEMATGAEMVGTVFYHAIGYNVVDVYLVEIDPARLTISPTATIRGIDGTRRPFTRDDVDEVLRRSARLPNGNYRALASRFAEGEPLGAFRYYGTRPDDPNDIFPHEHRRELRGNRVFAAWLNHDDSRSLNSLDMLETGPDGKKHVKHYMFDFGSIMGSGTAFPQVPRAGNEYIVDWGEGFKSLATLGLYVRPWQRVDYPSMPTSVGRFEGDFFDPLAWKPEYPNPAFGNMRPDDAFWAARIVARFSDEMIRAAVDKGGYSDPRAVDYLTGTLIERRDKVLRTWLNGVNPLVDFALDSEGVLTFSNAAVEAGVATPASSHEVQWARFDNAAGVEQRVGEPIATSESRVAAPVEPVGDADYITATIRSIHAERPAWAEPVRVYFRRSGRGWETVGIDRMVDPDVD